MGLFLHDYHVSQSLSSISQWLGLLDSCYYLAFICRLLRRFFHVVSLYLTHSIDVSGILFVFPDKFTLNNTNHICWLVVVITVECGVRHSFQSHHLLHRHLFRINTDCISRCLDLLSFRDEYWDVPQWRSVLSSHTDHHSEHRCWRA